MIGVFDSGLGGLTIFKELIHTLPKYDYLYLGDNHKAPYGNRSSQEIFQFTLEAVEYLFQHNCQIVILACNTASAVALQKIQQEVLPKKYPDKKVLGILVPTIEKILGYPWTHPLEEHHVNPQHLGIIGTQQTINSNSYLQEITKRTTNLKITQLACPLLVPLIESNTSQTKLQNTIKHYIQQLPKDLDSLLLGCTHYEIIAQLIKNELLPTIQIYQQPQITTQSLKLYLSNHPEIKSKLSKTSNYKFLTTGDKHKVSLLAEKFFSKKINFQHIEL